MTRMIATVTLAALTTLAVTTGANAWGTSSSDIDRTQANQAARINQGLRDGSLTRREAEALAAEQRRIQALESAAKRDGVVTRGEQAAIKNAQENASRHIYQERHDSESRWSRWTRWGSRSHDYSGYQAPRRWWW